MEVSRQTFLLYADENNLPFDISATEFVSAEGTYYEVYFIGQEELCSFNEIPQPLRMEYDVQIHELAFSCPDDMSFLGDLETKLSDILMNKHL